MIEHEGVHAFRQHGIQPVVPDPEVLRRGAQGLFDRRGLLVELGPSTDGDEDGAFGERGEVDVVSGRYSLVNVEHLKGKMAIQKICFQSWQGCANLFGDHRKRHGIVGSAL